MSAAGSRIVRWRGSHRRTLNLATGLPSPQQRQAAQMPPPEPPGDACGRETTPNANPTDRIARGRSGAPGDQDTEMVRMNAPATERPTTSAANGPEFLTRVAAAFALRLAGRLNASPGERASSKVAPNSGGPPRPNRRRDILRGAFLAAVALAAIFALLQVFGLEAEAVTDPQASQVRTVDWYYWLDKSGRGIHRALLYGSQLVQTVADSNDIWIPNDFVVGTSGQYVYWTDDGHNEIRRKAVDGSSAVETLVDTDITTPKQIAVDASWVYWIDTGERTIKRVSNSGVGSVETLADSDDGVTSPHALVVAGSYLYWADNYNDAIYRVELFGSNTITTLVDTGIGYIRDMEIGRYSDYLYWGDSGTRKIKRVHLSGSNTVTTLTTTGYYGPMQIALDPANDYVYWLRSQSSSDWLERVATTADGATAEVVTTATGALPTDVVVGPDGDRVYWADDNGNRIKTIAADGSDSVANVLAHTLNNPIRLRLRAGELQTIDSACITDAGSFDADFSTLEWDAEITAACPQAYYTFHVSEPFDIKVEASSSDLNPMPILRSGGIGGDVVRLPEVTTGAIKPYVVTMKAGDHAIELNREHRSSNETGDVSVVLRFQPALEGCDLNLGTLSSETLTVFGGYEADCGNARDYFFYLEFQATVSASLSAAYFSPSIALRPGSASDSAAATATDSGNPADIYTAVASGSYRITVNRIDADSTYTLALQAFGLPPPTRTPMPTPTPRFQPNVDVRLDPDPRGVEFRPNQVYSFRLEGSADTFPALVRTTNATALPITAGGASSLDCAAGSEVTDIGALDSVHLHACRAGAGSTIEVIRENDRALLAQYPVYVAGDPVPTPSAVQGPSNYTGQGEDQLGLGIVVGLFCEAANVDCNMNLAVNGIALLVVGIVPVAPTMVARGRPSAFSIGIGVALGIATMLLANQAVGLPLYMSGIALMSVFMLAVIALFIKFRRVRA